MRKTQGHLQYGEESADALNDAFQLTKKSEVKEEKRFAPQRHFPTPERRLPRRVRARKFFGSRNRASQVRGNRGPLAGSLRRQRCSARHPRRDAPVEIVLSSASSVHTPVSGRVGPGLEGELDEVGVPGVDPSQQRGLASATDTNLCRIQVLHRSTGIPVKKYIPCRSLRSLSNLLRPRQSRQSYLVPRRPGYCLCTGG